MTSNGRHGYWSPSLQQRYLDHLSHSGNVRDAASLCGLSRQSAYKLRRRDPAFAGQWNAALDRFFEQRARMFEQRYRPRGGERNSGPLDTVNLSTV